MFHLQFSSNEFLLFRKNIQLSSLPPQIHIYLTARDNLFYEDNDNVDDDDGSMMLMSIRRRQNEYLVSTRLWPLIKIKLHHNHKKNKKFHLKNQLLRFPFKF